MNNITMTAPKTPMPVWFARLQEIATAKGWNVEDPVAWEAYYDKGYTRKMGHCGRPLPHETSLRTYRSSRRDNNQIAANPEYSIRDTANYRPEIHGSTDSDSY